MLETPPQTTEKEFINGFIPGVSVSVDEDNIAKLYMRTWPQGLEYNQEQITEMIGMLVEVHDYMEHQKGDNTMPLFNDTEDNIEEVEIETPPDEELTESTEFDEIMGNATAFLYMKEDFANQRISNHEMFTALHILRDSINSYLNLNSVVDEHGTEKQQ
tara:strand:+ start:1618 stop:2094 length:477 start_codon:yes stop_codon:yes gene_type:complete